MKNHQTQGKLVIFLYLLMRDYLVPGKVEKIMESIDGILPAGHILSNGFLAEHAEDLAKRLTQC